MRITECYVDGFGKLSKKKYVFSDGLNQTVGKNGYGKSTLAAFIHAMLFGLSDSKKTSLDENDRRKYTPWGGGAFGGSLTFETGGKLFRIERSFGKRSSEDSFTLYDARSASPSSTFSERLGEELFGIDSDGFLRTVFLSEKSLSEKNENKSIGAKLSGLTGASADIGELDSALDILEARRKFYYKKGGSGIISDVRGEISELDTQIAALEHKETSLKEARVRLASLKTEFENEKELKKSLEAERKQLDLRKRIQSCEAQYENMRQGLLIDEEKRQRLERFFKNGRPTVNDIEKNRKKLLEYEIAAREESTLNADSEFAELNTFFKSKTDFEQCDRMYALARLAESKSPEENSTETQNTSSRQSGLGLISLISFLLSSVFAVSGILLGIKSPLGLILASSACGLAAFSLFLFIFKKRKRKSRAFLGSASDKSKEALARQEVLGFLARFPLSDNGSLTDAVKEVRSRLQRLEALNMLKQRMKESSSNRLAYLALGMKEAKDFLSLYETSTNAPFDEISTALTELTLLEERLENRRRELSEFAKANGLEAEKRQGFSVNGEELLAKWEKNEKKLSELSGEILLLERKIESDSAETDRKALLKDRRDSLDCEAARYEASLDIIQKTKKFLTDAHEGMTARYLGKTKSSFIRYLKIIGEVECDFALDTAFSVTSYEGATARKSESYSRGVRQLFMLAVRLALCDSLFDKEKPFLILDDPFMSFDDPTLKRAKKTLLELAKSRQIIYFTCSKNRAIE